MFRCESYAFVGLINSGLDVLSAILRGEKTRFSVREFSFATSTYGSKSVFFRSFENFLNPTWNGIR